MAEGYWPRIADRESALAAVRMAGLPVFLMGLSAVSAVLLSVLAVLQIQPTTAFLLSLIFAAATGVVLMALGLAIRKGRTSLVLLAAFITFANAMATAWIAPWWASIIQVLMVLLALSGLRGWWWLRKQPE
jgi:hypothetical protein